MEQSILAGRDERKPGKREWSAEEGLGKREQGDDTETDEGAAGEFGGCKIDGYILKGKFAKTYPCTIRVHKLCTSY